MLSVKIPFIKGLDEIGFIQNPYVLIEKGEKFLINKNNWEDKFPYTPNVVAYLAYDNDSIMGLFDVQCIGLRTLSPSDGNYVHEDSCVEFFMQKEKGSSYINIEFNAFGICYASKHSSPKESIPFSQEEYNCIKRFTTIKEQGLDKDGEYKWSLAFKIPWTLLGYEKGIVPDLFYANLYKCGDKTTIPHFLSWNEIKGYDNPAFHCPENFGTIETEKD